MIRTTLAFFGYVKIPVEAVQLSISLECLTESLKEYAEKNPRSIKGDNHDEIKRYHVAAKTLTKFLRSGKLLA